MKICEVINRNKQSILLVPLNFYLLSFILVLSLTACLDDNTQPEECGPHQIVIDGECECEDGYHWNEDNTKCVLDTTSHDFTWEVLAGGATLGSSFHGVEIIAPDDIWVVGRIFTDEMDSNDNWIKYNAAYYNGSGWSLERLIVRQDAGIPGDYVTTYDSTGNDLESVYKIDNEIWFIEGSSRARLIDSRWDYFPEDQYWSYYYGAYRMWGTDKDNLYITGKLGSITHYDGENFHHQDLGTDIPLRDIYGLDENHIWAVGYDRGDGSSVIYFYDGTNWNEKYYFNLDLWDGVIDTDTLDGQVASVWAYGDTVYFCCSTGIWKESISTGEGKLVPSLEISEDGYYSYKGIRGNNYNDIMVVGLNDHRFHYNGKSWFKCGGVYYRATLEALDVQGDNFVIVGHTKELQGLIIQGKR